MSNIHPTAKIYPNVRLGNDVRVGPWVVIGVPARGMQPGAWETTIADGAVIRSHTVLYAGSRIGPGFQTGHRTVVGPAMEIGANCSIGAISVCVGFARLCDGARVHGHCYVEPFASCGEKSWVGPNCIVESSLQCITHVGSGAILGLRAHLLPGTRVGERALVGTRCLICRDVKPYRVMVGNPPRAVRTIDNIKPRTDDAAPLYVPDLPEVRDAVLAAHAARAESNMATDHWRVVAWHLLQEVQQADNTRPGESPALVPTKAPLNLDNRAIVEP
jgi:acyl-[acyl carrier protein]--UDP-N-acetylglucosamine O-acyltransferase